MTDRTTVELFERDGRKYRRRRSPMRTTQADGSVIEFMLVEEGPADKTVSSLALFDGKTGGHRFSITASEEDVNFARIAAAHETDHYVLRDWHTLIPTAIETYCYHGKRLLLREQCPICKSTLKGDKI